MATYTYQVRDKKSGKITKGKIIAANVALVKESLAAADQVILQIREQSKLADVGSLSIGGKKVKRKDVAIFARQFATMIEAGLPITKCLTILSAQTDSVALRGVIAQISLDVESGGSLSAAVAKHPKAFPKIFVSMVHAGEVGGVLDIVLVRVADHFESELALRGKIKSAITYPVAMGALVFIIALAMLIFIVPTFQKMFADMGAKLPAITAVMITLSDALLSWKGPATFVVVIAAVWGFNKWRKGSGAFTWDTLVLNMPVTGSIAKKMAMSRFTRTFSTLVSAGVPMLASLDIVADTSGNEAIAKVVLEAKESVREGNLLAKPFSESKIFPSMVSQMIAVGEETGSLDVMLSKIADFYDEEVSSAVASLTSTLEPVMMALLGGVVGTMVIGLYLPMFQMVAIVK
ncbi:MAG: type II secretion system F family protein [Coriobacteriia bacterium]|nr:type II secretion system F family protein [Coriobacteriia bacterium]